MKFSTFFIVHTSDITCMQLLYLEGDLGTMYTTHLPVITLYAEGLCDRSRLCIQEIFKTIIVIELTYSALNPSFRQYYRI